MGACQAGSCLWSTAGGTVPWTALAWVAKGLCALVWSLLSVRVGVVSVAALPVVMDCDLPQPGWPPKVASSSPQVPVPGHVSLVTACGCVYVNVCIYVSHVCIFVGVGGSGFLDFLFCFSLLFLSSVRHFVLPSV